MLISGDWVADNSGGGTLVCVVVLVPLAGRDADVLFELDGPDGNVYALLISFNFPVDECNLTRRGGILIVTDLLLVL